MWFKREHKKELHDVNNYVRGIGKQVELIDYHQHPMELDDNFPLTQQNEEQSEEQNEREEISEQEEHDDGIMRENSNMWSVDSGISQLHDSH